MPNSTTTSIISSSIASTTSKPLTTTSKASSIYSSSQFSQITSQKANAKAEQRQMRKMKKEVEKQRRKLFGQMEKKSKFESTYSAMMHQTKEQQSKQKEVAQEAQMKRDSAQKTAQFRFQKEFYGQQPESEQKQSQEIRSQVTTPLGNRQEQMIPYTAHWDTFKPSKQNNSLSFREMSLGKKPEEQNNYMVSVQRKQLNLASSNVLTEKNNQKQQTFDQQYYYQQNNKAKFGSKADWKNSNTNDKVDNHINTLKVDTFREKQKQLASNIFAVQDYSKYQPISKKFIDMDNVYEKKRMNDPLYSDLFNQCMNTGGQKQSPTRKKGNEILSAAKDWTCYDNQLKLKRDYTNYQPREMLKRELRSTIDPFKVGYLDLSNQN